MITTLLATASPGPTRPPKHEPDPCRPSLSQRPSLRLASPLSLTPRRHGDTRPLRPSRTKILETNATEQANGKERNPESPPADCRRLSLPPIGEHDARSLSFFAALIPYPSLAPIEAVFEERTGPFGLAGRRRGASVGSAAVVLAGAGAGSWKLQCRARPIPCNDLVVLEAARAVYARGHLAVILALSVWILVETFWPSGEGMDQKKARAMEEIVRLICDDALTEVFRRLPARSLAACRLVCKSWMSVLSDPHFIHEHLSRGQKKLLFFANDRVHDRSLAMVFADDKESMYHVSRPMASRSLFVHNSCNGILCLGDSTGAVELLNPTTGESLVLPMPMYTAGSSQFSSCNWHCMGFCPGTKEHKIVHFYQGSHTESSKVCCEVYTIGDSVWRQVGSFHGAPTERGVHVNGRVYYLTKFRYIASSRINCLNLESEKFSSMVLPPRKSYGGHCSLTELEGKLCLLVVDGALEDPVRTMDILILDSDDKQSWTLKYSLSLPWLMPSCYFTPKYTLFHEGKILVQLLARSLYCYDPGSGSEELKMACTELDIPFSTHTFIESIVPLHKDYFMKLR